jgi:hypothetical protein
MATRHPRRRGSRFATTLEIAHLLGARNHLLQEPGNVHFERRQQSGNDPARQLLADRIVDRRVRVAKRNRPKGPDQVDVLVAVDVDNAATSRRFEIDRKGAVGERRWPLAARLRTTWDPPDGLIEQRQRLVIGSR